MRVAMIQAGQKAQWSRRSIRGHLLERPKPPWGTASCALPSKGDELGRLQRIDGGVREVNPYAAVVNSEQCASDLGMLRAQSHKHCTERTAEPLLGRWQ